MKKWSLERGEHNSATDIFTVIQGYTQEALTLQVPFATLTFLLQK